jgi:hypothetical protein
MSERIQFCFVDIFIGDRAYSLRLGEVVSGAVREAIETWIVGACRGRPLVDKVRKADALTCGCTMMDRVESLL